MQYGQSIYDVARQNPGESAQVPSTTDQQSTNDGAKFSLQTDVNGNQYVNVDTDQNIFEGADPKEYPKIAKQYILNHFKDQTLEVADHDLASVTKRTAGEYAYPAKSLDQATTTAKSRAATELDNLLKVSTYSHSAKDDGRHNIASDGWDYYDTNFVVDGKAFTGRLNIANSESGRMLYDITNIKELPGEYGYRSETTSLYNTVSGELSDNIVPQDTAGVNTSISNGAVNNAGNRQIRVAESELKLMEAIAKKGKIPFEIRDLGVDKQGKPIEGKYENGKIYVSPYAERPSLVIFKHELTHHLENDSYRYKELLEVVKEFYAKNGQKLGTDFAAEIRKKQDLYRAKGQNINGDEAVREVVADFVGEHLFTDETAIQYLADRKPHLARKIVNWIREQIAAIKGDAETELLLKAERIYVKALKNADKLAGIEGKASYALNPNFEVQYDSWDQKTNRGYFQIGTTSEALESIGINPSNIYWDKSKILKIKKEHPEMTDAIIKQVPQILENPVIIMQSQTKVNRVVALGDVYVNGQPILCALELKPDGNIQDFIKVASAYPKKTVQNLIDTSDILYVNPDKNRTDSWLKLLGLQLPSRLTNYGSISSVTYVDENVKGNVTFGKEPTKTAMQAAFEKAGYNTSISENSKNDTDKTQFSLSAGINQTEALSSDRATDTEDSAFSSAQNVQYRKKAPPLKPMPIDLKRNSVYPTRSEIAELEQLAKIHRINFEIDPNMPWNISGLYVPNENKIKINKYAFFPAMEVYKHELTHHIEKSKYYDDLLDVVKKYYRSQGNDELGIVKSLGEMAQEVVDNLLEMGYTESKVNQILNFEGDVNDESRSDGAVKEGYELKHMGDNMASGRSTALGTDGRRESGEDGRGIRWSSEANDTRRGNNENTSGIARGRISSGGIGQHRLLNKTEALSSDRETDTEDSAFSLRKIFHSPQIVKKRLMSHTNPKLPCESFLLSQGSF